MKMFNNFPQDYTVKQKEYQFENWEIKAQFHTYSTNQLRDIGQVVYTFRRK